MSRWNVVGLAFSLVLGSVAFASQARAQDNPPPPPPPPPAAPPPPPASEAAPSAPAQAPSTPSYAPAPPPPPPPPGYGAPAGYPPAPAARPAPGPARRGDPIRYEPEDQDVALMMVTGELPYRRVQRFRRAYYVERGFAPAYSPICEGPCTTELAPGEYHLGLSKDGGRAIPAGTVVLSGPATVHAWYEDRSGERLFGGILVVGGIVGGIVMIVASVEGQTCYNDGSCETNVNGPLLGGGIATIIGGSIIGGILAAQRDTAHISVTPLTMPSVGALKESPMAAFNAEPPPQGMALTVRF